MWYNLIQRIYNSPALSIWCVETKVKGPWYDLCKGYINKNNNFIDFKMQNTKLNLIKKITLSKIFFSYLLDTLKHRDRLTLSINLSGQIKQNDAIKKLYDPNFFRYAMMLHFSTSRLRLFVDWIESVLKRKIIWSNYFGFVNLHLIGLV